MDNTTTAPAPTATIAAGSAPAGTWPALDAVWRAAAPSLRARKNDIHTPLSFYFAELLLDSYPDADALVVRTAILLHDSGWSAVDEERIFAEGFSGDWRTSDVRYLHEREGCRIACEILPSLGYTIRVVDEITKIIDGHDTREFALSIEDSLVRDADRLWRFTPAGIALASGWFSKTPSEYFEQLRVRTLAELITPEARAMARAELDRSSELLQIRVL